MEKINVEELMKKLGFESTDDMPEDGYPMEKIDAEALKKMQRVELSDDILEGVAGGQQYGGCSDLWNKCHKKCISLVLSENPKKYFPKLKEVFVKCAEFCDSKHRR